MMQKIILKKLQIKCFKVWPPKEDFHYQNSTPGGHNDPRISKYQQQKNHCIWVGYQKVIYDKLYASCITV